MPYYINHPCTDHSQLATSASNHLGQYAIITRLPTSNHDIFLAWDRANRLTVVLKVFKCQPNLSSSYIMEKDALLPLSHPNIVKIHDYSDKSAIFYNRANAKVAYIALEYCPSKDLCEIMQKQGSLPTTLARTVFHKLLDGVSYLHQNQIANMDLKLENILLDKDLNIKIIDFDHALSFGNHYLSKRGTCGYRCPEVAQGRSDNLSACDIYSCGVILFILLSGFVPYLESYKPGKEPQYSHHYHNLRRNPDEFWNQFSKMNANQEPFTEELKELIMSMLTEDPQERATMEDIRCSQWFNGSIYDEQMYREEMHKYLMKKV